MRFLHLADLHLGKNLCGYSLLADQRTVLEDALHIAHENCASAIVLAGDIYDKSVPSEEAIQLYDGFLRGAEERGIPVLCVSGNHDSAERLAFGASLMRSAGYWVSPVYDGNVCRAVLRDEFGAVNFYLLPFLKPVQVRRFFSDAQIESYTDAVRLALSTIEMDFSERNVLITHQFVRGSLCSEPDLSVGGIDQVDGSVFGDFDYTALGHIHGAQAVAGECVRYAGSIVPCSFSECGQVKSATLVELGEKGDVSIKLVPLHQLHGMRKLRGTYMELSARDFYSAINCYDYMQVTLTDEEDVPGAFDRLRLIYPNLMQLLYDNCRQRIQQALDSDAPPEKERTPFDWLDELFRLQNNREMSEEERKMAQTLLEKCIKEDEMS